MKKSFYIGLALIGSIFIGGCGNQKSASQTNVSTNNTSKSSHVSHKKKSKSKAKNEVAKKQTDESANNRQQVTQSNSDSKQPTTPVMNLEEIKNGSYTSILGNWQEVATRANHHDTRGGIWGDPNPENKLTVSNSKVMDTGYSLAGNKLSAINDNSESSPIQYIPQKGSLDITGDVGAAEVSFCFYPKGVPMIPWEDNLPSTINTDAERIVIRVSGNDYIEVFQRVSNAS